MGTRNDTELMEIIYGMTVQIALALGMYDGLVALRLLLTFTQVFARISKSINILNRRATLKAKTTSPVSLPIDDAWRDYIACL